MGTRVVAEHARRFGRGEIVYDPWHYVNDAVLLDDDAVGIGVHVDGTADRLGVDRVVEPRIATVELSQRRPRQRVERALAIPAHVALVHTAPPPVTMTRNRWSPCAGISGHLGRNAQASHRAAKGSYAGCRLCTKAEGNTDGRVTRECPADPARSETLACAGASCAGTGRSLASTTRAVSVEARLSASGRRKLQPIMHDRETSDSAIVAAKPTNNAPDPHRGGGAGGAKVGDQEMHREQSTHRTQSRARVTRRSAVYGWPHDEGSKERFTRSFITWTRTLAENLFGFDSFVMAPLAQELEPPATPGRCTFGLIVHKAILPLPPCPIDQPGRSGSLLGFRYDDSIRGLPPSDVVGVQILYGPASRSNALTSRRPTGGQAARSPPDGTIST